MELYRISVDNGNVGIRKDWSHSLLVSMCKQANDSCGVFSNIAWFQTVKD